MDYTLSSSYLELQEKLKKKFPPMEHHQRDRKDLVIFPPSAPLPDRPECLHRIRDDSEGYDWMPGWYISDLDLDQFVHAFSHLRLKDGFKLRGYRYVAGGNGNGIVWAIPKSEELPFPDESKQSDGLLKAPTPDIGVHPMEVIEGDRTPISYLQAAILFQEIKEFGARWHGVSWGWCTILPTSIESEDSYPRFDIDQVDPTDWTKLQESPDIWLPHFFRDDENNPTVVFYVYHPVLAETIYKVTSTFKDESYDLECEFEPILQGEGGIIP